LTARLPMRSTRTTRRRAPGTEPTRASARKTRRDARTRSRGRPRRSARRKTQRAASARRGCTNRTRKQAHAHATTRATRGPGARRPRDGGEERDATSARSARAPATGDAHARTAGTHGDTRGHARERARATRRERRGARGAGEDGAERERGATPSTGTTTRRDHGGRSTRRGARAARRRDERPARGADTAPRRGRERAGRERRERKRHTRGEAHARERRQRRRERGSGAQAAQPRRRTRAAERPPQPTDAGSRGNPTTRRGRDAERGATRARRTAVLMRGALPGRGLKSDRRRRRLYVAPRERRRDGRRVREGPLRVCGDPASRSRRDAGPGAHKNRRSSARSRPPQRAPSGSDALWRVRGAARTSVHMMRTHGRGQQPSGVRRLLPRRRTLRATGTAHVHPHARRATGATGALREERPTTKTTARNASGTPTRRSMSARARSSPMRGSGLAQLSRRRIRRTQEESPVGSNAYDASRPVPERRVMARTRRCADECTHGADTWPRTATERRSTPAAATPNTTRHGNSARPPSRAARYRRYRGAD